MQAQELKKELQLIRVKSKATLKDLVILLRCVEKEDYRNMFDTDLYIKHGGEYCTALQIINKHTVDEGLATKLSGDNWVEFL